MQEWRGKEGERVSQNVGRFGRGAFNKGKTHAHVSANDWKWFRFSVFDQPEVTHQLVEYEDRYRMLVEGVYTYHPFLMLCPMVKCEGRQHILKK